MLHYSIKMGLFFSGLSRFKKIKKNYLCLYYYYTITTTTTYYVSCNTLNE